MENFESQKEKSPMDILADKLDPLQAEKNDGRGVGCVQTLIAYLRMGNINKAKAVCLNESDKIRIYPDIKEILENELMQEKF